VLALALAVTAIALPDSLNPTLIVAAVYLTTGPHPVRGVIAFTLAAFAVTLAGGLAIALGLADVVVSLVPKPSATLKWSILTVVGILLVGGGGVIWWRRASLADSEPPSQREHTSHGPALLMGAGIAGVELLSAFPYFAAIAMVAGSSVSFAGKLFLLVLYDMIYVLPLIAIVVVRVVMGERGTQLLSPIGDWIAMRWPVVVAPMAAVVGIGLTAYGLVRLT
jgi:cytochrome c biogenesis protein CcdA